MRRAILEIKLAGARNDILRLFGSLGVPAEPLAWLNLVDDGRGRRGSTTTINGERTGPVDGR